MMKLSITLWKESPVSEFLIFRTKEFNEIAANRRKIIFHSGDVLL